MTDFGAPEQAQICLADGAALVRATWAEYLRPPRRLTVTAWAEQHRILSAKDSAEPGPYRATRTPYAVEPQDALSAASDVEEVVLMWGAQTGKTTIGSNWLGYLADTNPGPVMIVQPTIDLAKRYSRQRLAPMVEESPVLKRKVSDNRSRNEANTTLLKEFPGGFMAIAGANSAAGLRSMPVRDLFLDEVDAYPLDVDGEGDPCQLAEARQTTFARRKRLKTSTPTIKDFSRIEAAWLASDQRSYHVPCPHCGHRQPLLWDPAPGSPGLKWHSTPEGQPLPETAHYLCTACGAEIPEHHKPSMFAAGQWVAANPASRVRGYQLSSLYSPLGWLSWADIVRQYLTALTAQRQGDSTLMRTFVNTRLAQTYEDAGDRADEAHLRKRAADIPLRQVHTGLFVMTLGVDVQGDRLEAYLWAWGRGMERQLVDRAVFYGDPAMPESEGGSPWKALTDYRRTPVHHASGKPVPILAGMVDTGGHHTQAVYAYSRTWQHEHILAVKGSSQAARAIVGKPTDQDVTWRGQRLRRGVKLWPIGTDTAKSEIHGRLRVPDPGPGYVWISKHQPPEVFEQLTAERLVTRFVKGRPRLEWVKIASRRNEALDCAVYALAAAHYVGIDRWREGDWRRWQDRVEARDLFDDPAPSGHSPAAVTEAAEPPQHSPPSPPVPKPAPDPAPATAPPAPNAFAALLAQRRQRRPS